MSLYTPVFPPTDPPAARTPSSSSISSVETREQRHGLSYSSRLSQWHLAIAALPYELCPPSALPSSDSQERSAKLQADIEKAVRDGRNITDYCKLRCTKVGYATKQPAHSNLEQGDGIPWILAQSEEEWLEWEREMAQRRSRQKGKERANLAPPPTTQSQKAHDKVLSWKAGLLAPCSSPVTMSPAPSASTARSTLGFPVVKRSTMTKENKLKASPSVPLRSAPRPTSVARADGEKDPALRINNGAISPVHVATASVEHSNSFPASHQPPNPPSEAKQEAPVYDASGNTQAGICDFSAFPPPSFPSDLITSTQKDAVRTLPAPLSSLPLDLPVPMSKDEDNTDATAMADDLGRDRALIPENEVQRSEPVMRVPDRQFPQATPPSPPYSSETSQPHVLQADVPPSEEIIHIPATPPREFVRTLTPPPDVEIIAPAASVSSGMQQSSPRTPERMRRPSSEKNFLVPRGGGFINGHVTPDAAINGATAAAHVIHAMAFPRTPERNRQALPDPLTTSHKSRPRPRPPSRKHSVQDMDMDGAASEAGDGVDPSPAKSDRSYFSSPASGSSSGSDFSRGSMLFAPGSPTSPLGFTQNPSRFAPLAHSTQLSSKGPLVPSSPLQSKSQNRSQSQSQKKLGVGMSYNSQFDVDARVDQLSNFMRQDVDVNAWARSTDTEEDEDVIAVDEMTRTYPASPLGP